MITESQTSTENSNLQPVRSPSIAVVFPNWNDSKFLRTCLNSIQQQSVPPDELLIVDDQSTDDSVSIIREMIKDCPWARLIVNEVNIGANRSVAVGLKNVRSEYVLTLSSNDFVLPGLVSRAKQCLANYPTAGIWSAMTCFADEADRIVGLHPSPVIACTDTYFSPAECRDLAIKFGSWFASNTMVFRREALLSIGGFNHDYKGLSDMLAALVVASREGAIFSPKPFGVLRLHPEGLLERSLGSAASVDSLLQTVYSCGPNWEPALFSTQFLKKLGDRLYFAYVRVSKGKSISAVSGQFVKDLEWAFRILRIIPVGCNRLRVGLAFILLRPYDVMPTIWYRVLKPIFVRVQL